MGKQYVTAASNAESLRHFMKCVLRDLEAFEQILETGGIESEQRRIGAEQEVVLVDSAWRPAPAVEQVLPLVDSQYFTTELGKFQIEFNCDPFRFEGHCLRKLENQIHELFAQVQRAAQEVGVHAVLTGILPTLNKEDLTLDNMTPVPRYRALSDAFDRLRGGVYRFRIKGPDELAIQHDNMMLESCNNSFQVHLQVTAEEFAPLYNVAQLIAAPTMAAAVNSPLLFGRRLWRETRLALFQQSVDTRGDELDKRRFQPRVSFGTKWVQKSVLEIFKEDISRFRTLIGLDEYEDPFDALEEGRAPSLDALRLHNGTVYRWNRPCYGISDGKPHLRIENRVLPAGPTPIDEVANAALWFGLMLEIPNQYGDVTQMIEFDDARSNLLAACRFGLESQFTWIDGEAWPAKDLILRHLLPLAHQGLETAGIADQDRERYLNVIEERVMSGQTGAQWMLRSLQNMDARSSSAEKMGALVAATHKRQQGDQPGHQWKLAELHETGGWREHYQTVDAFMHTDLFTVHQDELIDLAANVMDWSHIRHVPVEDDEHRLVGLVTHRALLRYFSKREPGDESLAVSEIMGRNPVTVTPDTPTLVAIALMRERRISCLPVVQGDRLVGIVTEHDFMEVASQLLEQKLRQ